MYDRAGILSLALARNRMVYEPFKMDLLEHLWGLIPDPWGGFGTNSRVVGTAHDALKLRLYASSVFGIQPTGGL
jgi:hypothetical protein